MAAEEPQVGDALKSKIRKQVEFYFSDSNLPRDAFLLGKTRETAEGWVSLALLCTFTRMAAALALQQRQEDLVPPAVLKTVAEALEPSELVEVSSDGQRVRRKVQLASAEDASADADSRTLYASPFPFDADLDSLQALFGDVGDVRAVRMRRHTASKDFKGSAFVELASVEEAERVRALDLVFEGAKIQMEGKIPYLERRAAEKAKAKEEGEDLEAAEAAAEAAAKAASKGTAQATAQPAATEGAAAEGAAAQAGSPAGEDEPVPDFTRGCTIRFSFLEPSSFVDPPTFALVKDSFGGREGGVQFVDYERGEKEGSVRFAAPERAQAVLAETEDRDGAKVRPLAGYDAEVRVLQGDEEVAYTRQALKARAAAEEAKGTRGGGGRSRGRGGRGGTRGGKRGFDGGHGGGRGKRGRR